MKANELRIGNYALYPSSNLENGKDIIEVIKVTSNDIKELELKYFLYAIPLTEEWLFKFGFDSIGCIKLKNQTTFQVTMNEIGSVVWNANITQFVQLSECKYVHQLQNLYFALTGEELEIK